MALKDWKVYQRSKDDIVYKKKKGLTKLFITREIDQYIVEVPGFMVEPGYRARVFKTKSQALKFAEDYMKKHPSVDTRSKNISKGISKLSKRIK